MKNKKLIMSIVAVSLVIVISVLAVIGIRNNDPKVEESSTSTSTTASTMESTTTESITVAEPESNDYINLNEDGVAPLMKYSSTGDILCRKALELDNEGNGMGEYVYLLRQVVGMPILKIDTANTIAIYDDYDDLTFIKVDVEPIYVVPLDFGSMTSDFFATPQSLGGGRVSKEKMNGIGAIDECNGEPLKDFIEKNSCRYLNCFYGADQYRLIVGDKNEIFELGGYVGTKWVTVKVKANIELYTPSIEQSFEIQSKKTKNGYFVIDVSSLEKGIYFIQEYETFIELV